MKARRIWKRSKAFVEVYDGETSIAMAGGVRAERARSVIVVQWYAEGDPSCTYKEQSRPGIYGLRFDALRAAREADLLRVPRLVQPRYGRSYQTTGAHYCEALLVEEASWS